MKVVHFPWKDLESAQAACGQRHPNNLSEHTEQVTCLRCRNTLKFQWACEQPMKEQPMDENITPQQRQAITQERHHTVRECLEYLREGDSHSCHLRLVRGFQRQVRLAGLEHHLREVAAS